jgi:hypothetical protein
MGTDLRVLPATLNSKSKAGPPAQAVRIGG